MAIIQELLEYQKVDGELRKIEQAIASTEERKKYIQAKKFMESAREKLDMQDKRAAELKQLKEDLAARCEQVTKAIAEYADLDEMIEDGGDVSFYKKNAQALADKLRGLKADIAKLVADVESTAEDYKKLKEQTLVMQKQYKEYSEKYKEVKASHAAEVNAINTKLASIGKKIPAEMLEKYNSKRKERIFPILAPLNGDRCVCGMDLSLAQRSKLSGGNVIECEHCRRFIYSV